jgi:hypothetical protein
MSTEINDLTFSELCERIKIDYEDKLPESAYNSPEALIEAMKALQTEKVIFPKATGYSYHFNALKMQFLQGCIHYPCQHFTLRQICEFIGLSLKKVQDMVSIWNRRKYRYLTKLKKRTSNHENVYKLRKYAIVSCIAYTHNFYRGFDLCRKKNHESKKVNTYVSINGHGRRMGLKDADLPEIKISKHDT